MTLDRDGLLFSELDEAIAVGFGERLAAAREARRSVDAARGLDAPLDRHLEPST